MSIHFRCSAVQRQSERESAGSIRNTSPYSLWKITTITTFFYQKKLLSTNCSEHLAAIGTLSVLRCRTIQSILHSLIAVPMYYWLLDFNNPFIKPWLSLQFRTCTLCTLKVGLQYTSENDDISLLRSLHHWTFFETRDSHRTRSDSTT